MSEKQNELTQPTCSAVVKYWKGRWVKGHRVGSKGMVCCSRPATVTIFKAPYCTFHANRINQPQESMTK